MRTPWNEVKQRWSLSLALLVALAIQFKYWWAWIGATGLVLTVLVVAALTLLPSNRIAPWSHLWLPTVLVAIGTLVLTLYYLPFTHFNPEVNWAIGRGDGYAFPPSGEIDPAYIILFFPIAELLVTLVCFGFFGGIALWLRSSQPAKAA